jgi:diguanylate cyclase (GGDEF)-like protein
MVLDSAFRKGRCEFVKKMSRKPCRDRSAPVPYRRLIAVNRLVSQLAGAGSLQELQRCLTSAYAVWQPGAVICLSINEADTVTREESPNCGGPAVGALQPIIPLPIDNALKSNDLPREAEPLSVPSRSVYTFPLLALNRLLGYLEITSIHPRRFTALDCRLSLLVASQVALSLENIAAREKLGEVQSRLLDQEQRLVELHQRLQEQAHTDDLTGLFNRRRLIAQLEGEIARVWRYGGELSCLMIDIDGFKPVNDTCGHLAGDQVLRQLGDIFRRSCRATDFIARYGGDEFTVLLPQTDAVGAACAAEKLRREVQQHRFLVGSGQAVNLSISIGVTTCADPEWLSAAEVISRADRALYGAKRAGGDMIFKAGSPEEGSIICQIDEPALTQYALVG